MIKIREIIDKIPPPGANLWMDMVWGAFFFILIILSIFFYTGGESRFIYTDF